MATSTTAPVRPTVNTFNCRLISIAAGGLELGTEVRDSGGNVATTLRTEVSTNAVRRITFDATGMAAAENMITIAGIMATILTGFVGASGSIANRLLAVDTILQANGVYPA